MSHDRRGGGGYRRRYRGENTADGWFRPTTIFADDYDDRRRDVYESPEEILRTAIIKLGEVVSIPLVSCSFTVADESSAGCPRGTPPTGETDKGAVPGQHFKHI